MDLSTTYLGLRLPHPLVVGSGPLTDDLDMVRALEDAGAAALVLRPLYEEDVTGEQMDGSSNVESHRESFAEAGSYAPEPATAYGPDEYLEHLRRVKAAVRIPVIASLNAVTTDGWVSCARLLDQAGADAIELQIVHAASDMTTSAGEVERCGVDVVRGVKQRTGCPSPSS
jgi:dihydroorotate dehydrogenase (fumarate)